MFIIMYNILVLYTGVTLDGDGKRYSQVVERSFHISMAALETTGRKGNYMSLYFNDKTLMLVQCKHLTPFPNTHSEILALCEYC